MPGHSGGGECCAVPAADRQAPVLVFIHGGYWQRNSRELFAIAAEGALARGLTVAMPGYTLAPAATMTRIVAEIRAALDWLDSMVDGQFLCGAELSIADVAVAAQVGALNIPFTPIAEAEIHAHAKVMRWLERTFEAVG